MIFSSYVFILLFLPIVLVVFLLIGAGFGNRASSLWLISASFFFYGWWNTQYLSLLAGSILFNYYAGGLLAKKPIHARFILISGIFLNLGLIVYYKYSVFFMENISSILGIDFNAKSIVLPLAISFFTFQQVAYLVDSYRREVSIHTFADYCLFISFFPQLIAGPIVHHKEMLPQFTGGVFGRFNHKMLSIGLTFFSIGLFKKVIFADKISVYADSLFDAVSNKVVPTVLDSWGGALAYSLQLYYDFSGYSDMAIGLALIFGFQLPVNFNSPYKAPNIIEFWRRWHISLSRFLRNYLYIPLGGNRLGREKRHINLMVTMLLGGLWHGAGWNFIIWGFLHGSYLIINHCWQGLISLRGVTGVFNPHWHIFSRCLTFTSVVAAWVIFRAESMTSAVSILKGMSGMNGFVFPASWFEDFGWTIRVVLMKMGCDFSNSVTKVFNCNTGFMWIAGLTFIAFFFPNSQQIMSYRAFPDKDDKPVQISWKPTPAWALAVSMIMGICFLNLGEINEFLYYQF